MSPAHTVVPGGRRDQGPAPRRPWAVRPRASSPPAAEPAATMGAVDVRALAFDVFGTVVDWRSSVVEEVGAAAARHGLAVDAGAFADAWRRRYRPSMDRVQIGRAHV